MAWENHFESESTQPADRATCLICQVTHESPWGGGSRVTKVWRRLRGRRDDRSRAHAVLRLSSRISVSRSNAFPGVPVSQRGARERAPRIVTRRVSFRGEKIRLRARERREIGSVTRRRDSNESRREFRGKLHARVRTNVSTGRPQPVRPLALVISR